jgi:general secretion pathway protein G
MSKKSLPHRLFSLASRPKLNPEAGFTLIELLIGMVIIGILATLGFGAFTSSQQKARDSQRKSDLKQIGIALEAYYNDVGEYPLDDMQSRIEGCAGLVGCDWGESFVDDNGTVYMVDLPADPSSGSHYYYDSDGTQYQLYARLENIRDVDVPKDGGGAPQEFSGISCGEDNCNYGMSSVNTTPETGRTLVGS